MRYIAHIAPGPAWLPGKPIGEQDRAITGAHLVAMKRRYDEGSVLFGGPYTAEFGGIALIEAASEPEAAAIMDSDPAVIAGVMTYRLTPVRPFFDAFAGKAWSPPASR